MIEHNIFDVIVGYEDQNPISMRTIVSGQWKKGKETMVLWHGYGGSGSLYYKIIQDLQNEFNLIMFDNIGMAGSSRPSDFSLKFTP